MVVALVGLTGCTALNSEFDEAGLDSATSTSTAGTSPTTAPKESTSNEVTTKGGTSVDPSEPRTSGQTGDSTSGSPETTTTGRKFDVGKANSSGLAETGSTPGSGTLLWLSYPVNGNFYASDEDLCAPDISALGPDCLGPHRVLVGTGKVPFEELPGAFPFLSDGPLHAAGTGTVIATDFDALVNGAVNASFVEEITGDSTAKEIAMWRGPDGLGGATSCDDWMQSTGSATTYVVSGAMGNLEIASCGLLLPALCACSGTF